VSEDAQKLLNLTKMFPDKDDLAEGIAGLMLLQVIKYLITSLIN